MIFTQPRGNNNDANASSATEPRYKDADYGLATQRDCLARPPSDGKERCAYVKYNRKEVYMCFCKGDLCNPGTRPQAPVWLLAVSLAAVVAAHTMGGGKGWKAG